MNPLDFHKVAEHLISQGGAAEFRTAISRAYYGTYLFCYENINDLGFNLPRGSSAHGEIKCYLNNCGDYKLSKIASQLGDLHNKRIKADYFLYDNEVEKEKVAKAIFEQANRMINTIKNRFEENKDKITINIEDYRRNVLKLPY